MKNRVILNGQGFPVVPKSDQIAAQVASSDLKEVIRAGMVEAYRQGFEVAVSSLETSLKKAKESGGVGMTLDQGLELLAELRKIGGESIK